MDAILEDLITSKNILHLPKHDKCYLKVGLSKKGKPRYLFYHPTMINAIGKGRWRKGRMFNICVGPKHRAMLEEANRQKRSYETNNIRGGVGVHSRPNKAN